MSQPQTNIKSRPLSNVVALLACQEHYKPLDLCLRVLLGLLDLGVVLAQDRRVLPRGNGAMQPFSLGPFRSAAVRGARGLVAMDIAPWSQFRA